MDDTKPRTKSKRPPFCWQEKHVLRTIREMFEATGNVGSALLVYQALTEIASDMQSDIFVTTYSHIAQRAGLSARTVNRVIPTFEKLGIIAVRRNKINGVKGPSTYTVIRDATSRRIDVTRCMAQSRISEESQEQSLAEHSSKEEHSFSNKKESTHLSLTRQAHLPSFLLRKSESKKKFSSSLNCYTLGEQAVLEIYDRELVPLGFSPVNQYRESVCDAIATRDLKDWRELIDDIKTHPDMWPQRRTLVRLSWSQY
jgi:hypothetical protein